jgi:hypothetical protein
MYDKALKIPLYFLAGYHEGRERVFWRHVVHPQGNHVFSLLCPVFPGFILQKICSHKTN